MKRVLLSAFALFVLSFALYAEWTEVLDVYTLDMRNQPVPDAAVTITYQKSNPDSSSDGLITGRTDATGKFGTAIRNFVRRALPNTTDTNYEIQTYKLRASTYFWSSEELQLLQGQDYTGTRRIFVFSVPVYMQTVYIYARDPEGGAIADVTLKVTGPVAANLTTDGSGRATFRMPNTNRLYVSGTYKGVTVSNTSAYYDPTGLQSVNTLTGQYGISFASGTQKGNATNITGNFSTGSGVSVLFDSGAGTGSLMLSGKAVSLASQNGSVKAAASSDYSGNGRVVALESSIINDNTIEEADNLKFSVNALEWLLEKRNASRNDVCVDSAGLGNRYSGLVKISNEMAGRGYSVVGTGELPEARGGKEINAEVLAKCNVLVSDRRGVSREHPDYTSAEISAINAFISSNRSLLVSHEPGYVRDTEVVLLFDVYSERSLAVAVLDSAGNPLSNVSISAGGMRQATGEGGVANFGGITQKSADVAFTVNGVKYAQTIPLPLRKNELTYRLPVLLNITGAAASPGGEGCTNISASITDPRPEAATVAEVQYGSKTGPGRVALSQNGTAYTGTVCQNDTKVLTLVAYNQYDRASTQLGVPEQPKPEEAKPSPIAVGETAKSAASFAADTATANAVLIAAAAIVVVFLFVVRDSIIYPIKCAIIYVRKIFRR